MDSVLSKVCLLPRSLSLNVPNQNKEIKCIILCHTSADMKAHVEGLVWKSQVDYSML